MDWNRTQQVMHKWPPFAVPHVQLQQQPAIQHHIPHPQPHIQQPHPGLQHMQQPQPTQPQAPAQPAAKASRNNTPHCLVCNVHLGMFAKGGVEVFSDKVTTTHGKQQVHTILGNILNEELVNQGIHSSIICKKCFKLIDDIDALDDKITGMKQVVSNKYTMTLSLVKRGLVGKAVIDDDMKESLSKSARKDSTEEKPSKKKGRKPEKPRKITLKVEDTDSENDNGPIPDITNEESDDTDQKDTKEEIPVKRPTRKVKFKYKKRTKIRKVRKVVKFECSICDEPFDSEESLFDHLEDHGPKDDWFYCNECNKPFLTEETLDEHKKTAHRKKRKYKKNRAPRGSVQRLKKKRVIKQYKCQYCDATFPAKSKVHYHERTHTEILRYKCKYCDAAFNTTIKCRAHEKSHKEVKPWECDICGMNFRQKSNMITHKTRIHLRERRFKCTICGKDFGYKRLLQGHIMSIHTGERPFKCDLCDAAFVYQQHYDKHMRIHTGEKPYNCDVCGKAFASLNNCKSHMFTHTNKKPYECTVCGTGFMRKQMVLAHIKQHAHVNTPEDYIKTNNPLDCIREQGNSGQPMGGSRVGSSSIVRPKKKLHMMPSTSVAPPIPHHQLSMDDNIPHFIIPAETRESVVNLGGVNVSGVNVSGVNVSGVNVSGVNVSGVNVSGVNVSGVNVSGLNPSEPMNYLFGALQTPTSGTHYTSLNLGQW